MAFRKDESAQQGLEQAISYLVPKQLPPEEKQELGHFIDDLTVKLGPVVDSYPTWHPLVCHNDGRNSITHPNEDCGYQGLDHTIYFANGFLTCPYHDGEKVIDSVSNLWSHEAYQRYGHVAGIEAERIEKPLYQPNANPILVYCNWSKPMPNDKTIPKNIAIGLMLESEVPCWRWSSLGETWDTMRPYLLGQPCGKRSSVFVDQETGQAMKKIWEGITYSGMYGPLKV